VLSLRIAGPTHVEWLAEMNRRLIQDEGHRNPMTAPELAERMRGWLEGGEYFAAFFEWDGQLIAYALYREDPTSINLRQFYVDRPFRRIGLGRRAIEMLLNGHWPPEKGVTVEALVGNDAALTFWRAVGFQDYAVTLERPSSTLSKVDSIGN
jgi:GNAT superfamily N-acetyltransferase